MIIPSYMFYFVSHDFPTYTIIPSYMFISFEKLGQPTWLFHPTQLFGRLEYIDFGQGAAKILKVKVGVRKNICRLGRPRVHQFKPGESAEVSQKSMSGVIIPILAIFNESFTVWRDK